MDQSLLVAQGCRPVVIGGAEVQGYRIHIGERATMLADPSGRVLGVVMELAEEEARRLYAEPSVRDYLPQRVRAKLQSSGQWVDADCYILDENFVTGTNPAYAKKLAELSKSLGFEQSYCEEIDAFGALES